MQLSAKALLKPFSNSPKDDDTTECGNNDEDAGVEPIDEGSNNDKEDGEMTQQMTTTTTTTMMTHLRCWMRQTMSSYWKIQWLCM